jgi:hypothetical protein
MSTDDLEKATDRLMSLESSRFFLAEIFDADSVRVVHTRTGTRGNAVSAESKPKVFWDDDLIDVEFRAIGDDGNVTTHKSQIRIGEVFQAPEGARIFEATTDSARRLVWLTISGVIGERPSK